MLRGNEVNERNHRIESLNRRSIWPFFFSFHVLISGRLTSVCSANPVLSTKPDPESYDSHWNMFYKTVQLMIILCVCIVNESVFKKIYIYTVIKY